MSVLSSVEVTPNRVLILYRFLARQGGDDGVSRADLRSLLAAGKARGAAADPTVDNTLRETRALGLIQEDTAGIFRAAPDGPPAETEAVREAVGQVLLDPARAEDASQGRFPYALSWLLCQDPAQPLAWDAGVKGQVEADCGEDVQAYDLNSFARFQNLVYWARYLGYAWRLAVESSHVVIPDPTDALRRLLPTLLAEPRELPVADLITAWARVAPVLEGGSVRTEVEARFPAERRRPENELSHSTTLALLRLEDEGVIRMERRSDAPALLLTGRPISHVTLKG